MINADLIGWNRGINNYARFGEARTSQINDLRYQLMVQAKDHPETLQKMMQLLKNRQKRSTANKTDSPMKRTKFQRFRNFHKQDILSSVSDINNKTKTFEIFLYFCLISKSLSEGKFDYRSSSSRLSRSGNERKNSRTDILPSRLISPPLQCSKIYQLLYEIHINCLKIGPYGSYLRLD